MSKTLTCVDTIQRVGYTVIDGVRVVQYTCVIPSDEPQNMRLGMTKLNADMYKVNRDICRADFAEFEDECYKLQETCLANKGTGEAQTEGD